MKKNIFTLLLCLLLCLNAQAQTNQTIQTIAFKDGKTKNLKGILVSELIEKSAISGNEKRYKYISERKDSNITFYIYQEWIKPASGFDELKEYIFKTNMLNNDFEIQENQPDDNFSTKYYSLSLNTFDKEFQINSYNIYQASPDRTSKFSTFTINSLKKENLEKFLTDLKSIMPKPKTDE